MPESGESLAAHRKPNDQRSVAKMDRIFSLKFISYFYKHLVFISYILIFLYVVTLYRAISFQQVNPSNVSQITFSLDFCYELSIRGDKCKPSYSSNEIEKLDFPENCSFAMPIECYTRVRDNRQFLCGDF